jgi:dihydroorotate dehydrogenase electron transfer subunit
MRRASPGSFRARIVRSVRVSPSTRIVVFERPAGFPDAAPGQFVSVRVSDTITPLLRRPYSIMDLAEGEIELLVKVVGQGSALLAGASTGTVMELVGPLGAAVFPDPGTGPAVFVAGGTGLAPMIFAARTWRRRRLLGPADLVSGAACGDELLTALCEADFTAVHGATIDGSCGFTGDAVELLESLVDCGTIAGGVLYSCGPAGMVRALERRAAGSFSRHWTSLEAVMACGVGACRGCIVPMLGGALKAVCSDGTVFDASEIDWEAWEE